MGIKGSHMARAVVRTYSLGRAGTGTMQAGVLFEITRGEYRGMCVPFYGSLASRAAAEITVGALREAGAFLKKWGDLKTCEGLGTKDVQIFVDDDGRVSNVGARLAMRNRVEDFRELEDLGKQWGNRLVEETTRGMPAYGGDERAAPGSYDDETGEMRDIA